MGNIMKKLFLSLLSFFLAITILEITLRIKDFVLETSTQQISKTTKENYKIKYEYQPYLLWRGTPNQNAETFATNSNGLRGEKFSKEKKDQTYRIILLGGSAAWGYGSSSNETSLSYKVEKYLKTEEKDLRKKIEIYNFSENGYNSTQELILWREILEYHPDLIIQFTGYNDVYTGFLKQKAGWNHPFIKEDILIEDNLNTIKELLKIEGKKLLNKSRLFTSINHKTILVDNSDHNESKKYTDTDKVANLFSDNISLSNQLAISNNIPLLIIIQPMIFDEQKNITGQEKDIIENFDQDYPEAIVYFKEAYKQIKTRLDENKIQYFDGIDFFKDKKENIYVDPVHYNDIGQDFAAFEIANIIKEQTFKTTNIE
jgi:hypothetical protein